MQICKISGLLLAAMAALCGSAYCQENGAPNAKAQAVYDVSRETTLVGTVTAYSPSGQTAPRGAHVTLQTSAGSVDVHLGDDRLLAANHFTIQPGDTLRIIGENVAFGPGVQFVARIVQNGTNALQVRSVRGIPLSYAPPRGSVKPHGGVL